MEDLLRTVEQVRERIKRHHTELQKSEALTRYVLIDPILRALGWDTEDPEQVRPEFPTETGRPDYALMHGGNPRIMIEAKPLGTNLKDARHKGVNYVVAKGVPFFVCTDGDVWEVYDVFQPVALEEKCIVKAYLSNEGAGEVARRLLALWQPAAPQIKAAPASIIQQPLPTQLPGVSLNELRATVKCGDNPPQFLIFPDGHQEVTTTWTGLLVATAKWVAPKLRKTQLPIRIGPKNYLLDVKPVHSTGRKFYQPKKVNSLWLDAGHNAPDNVRFSCRLLETVGISPDEVRVEL